MEAILKQIKQELKPIQKAENFRYKHFNNSFQESLEYHDFYTLNRKKHFLVFRFVYQKQEESLSLIYNYAFNSRTIVVNDIHSLADYKNDSLPGIIETDKDKLKDIYKFSVEEGQIKNVVDIEIQLDTILSIFKNNYKNIIDYAKNITKTQKIPE
ncbi:hypothetical protein RJI07_00775 [Mycoplasmatota bacterium WC30]